MSLIIKMLLNHVFLSLVKSLCGLVGKTTHFTYTDIMLLLYYYIMLLSNTWYRTRSAEMAMTCGFYWDLE